MILNNFHFAVKFHAERMSNVTEHLCDSYYSIPKLERCWTNVSNVHCSSLQTYNWTLMGPNWINNFVVSRNPKISERSMFGNLQKRRILQVMRQIADYQFLTISYSHIYDRFHVCLSVITENGKSDGFLTEEYINFCLRYNENQHCWHLKVKSQSVRWSQTCNHDHLLVLNVQSRACGDVIVTFALKQTCRASLILLYILTCTWQVHISSK